MVVLKFPRLKGRGRIEASLTAATAGTDYLSFPRLKGRGRIEAEFGVDFIADKSLVSTAERSWPN